MLRKQDHNTYTFIAGNVTSSGLAVGTIVTPFNTNAGEVILTNLENKVIAGYPVTGPVRIVQSQGPNKDLIFKDIMDVEKTEVSWKNYRPAVQHEVVLGWDGTAGSLPSGNNTSYHVRINKRDNDAANRKFPQTAIAGQYKTDSTASQLEVAHGLAEQLGRNLALESLGIGLGEQNYLSVSITSDATIIANALGNASVAFNSTLVQFAGAITGAPAVGNEIQILGDSYIIDSIDLVNNTITLKSPYRGNSAAVVAVDDAFGTPATNYGLRFVGIRNYFDVNTFRDYYTNRFEVYFSDSLVRPAVVAASYEGVGEYEDVAMNEYLSHGFEGQNHMLSTPPTARDQNVVALATYGVLQLRWREEHRDLLSTQNAKGSVLVYFELANTNPDTLVGANGGGVLLGQFITNAALAARGLVPTSLNE